eukprot:4880369-Pyramimonas_sp.AAC.1
MTTSALAIYSQLWNYIGWRRPPLVENVCRRRKDVIYGLFVLPGPLGQGAAFVAAKERGGGRMPAGRASRGTSTCRKMQASG